jgi:hypothetical protein
MASNWTLTYISLLVHCMKFVCCCNVHESRFCALTGSKGEGGSEERTWMRHCGRLVCTERKCHAEYTYSHMRRERERETCIWFGSSVYEWRVVFGLALVTWQDGVVSYAEPFPPCASANENERHVRACVTRVLDRLDARCLSPDLFRGDLSVTHEEQNW